MALDFSQAFGNGGGGTQSLLSGIFGGGGDGGDSSNPFLKFLQSNGGSSLISGLLGGIGGIGQANQQNKLSQQQLALQQHGLGLNAQQGMANDALTRDQSLAQAAPTGWAQNYEQQTLIKNMMLQKLMNGNGLQPTNQAVADKLAALGPAFKPTIPDEWQNANPFGVNQSANSIQQRQGVLDELSGGRGPGMDISAYGGSADQQKQMDQYRNFQNQQYGQQNQNIMNAIGMKPDGTQLQMGSNPGMAQGQVMGNPAQGGGMMGKFGGIGGDALKGASLGSMVPGIGTMLGGAGGALYGLLKNTGGPSTSQQISQMGGAPQTWQDFGKGPGALHQSMQANQTLLQQLQAKQQQQQQAPQQQSQFRNPYLSY